MTTAHLDDLLRRLSVGMDAEMLAEESDRRLVERALVQRDSVALQAIVHRHGAMVYRVCRRVLQHTQDSEDAIDWLRLTDKMPPRINSALKAASFSAKPITAEVKMSSFRPHCGSALKMKTSCRSCGVPRTNQI